MLTFWGWFRVSDQLVRYCEEPTGEPMVVMTETTFPFMIEIPTGEVEMTSEGVVSQSGELLIR